MEQARIRPRLILHAFRWDGSPVAGFEIVSLSLDGVQPLQPTLVVKSPSVGMGYAWPGDWIVSGPAGPFVVSDGEFLEDYEVLR